MMYTVLRAEEKINDIQLKSKYWQRTHKYGIRIPKSLKKAYDFDEENVDKLWTYGIKKEMNKLR